MQGRSKYSESLHNMFLNRFRGKLSTIGKSGQIAAVFSASKPIERSTRTYEEIYPARKLPQSTADIVWRTTNSSIRTQAACEGRFEFTRAPFDQPIRKSAYWQDGMIFKYKTPKRRYIKPPERDRIRCAGHMQVANSLNSGEYYNTETGALISEKAKRTRRRHFSTPKSNFYTDFDACKQLQGSYWLCSTLMYN
eukprot:TRINITY_DN1370_c0_g1_i4.p1 TRINITY_DN1370_c0_g1~~TRINITY_DN1370_c0_g1_i4.p1  ORF type:complete len:194 (-),score=10.51 TRINITY_DN1370_c0_g1_i4:159-740(-)